MTQPLEPSDTEKEIVNLQKKLLDMQVLGSKVSDSLNILRGWIISVHSDVDLSMDEIISRKLYVTSNPHFQHHGTKSYDGFKILTSKVLSKISFIQKVTTLLEMDLIGEEEWEDLRLLNKTRVEMAHPRTGKFSLYEDMERQKWAYELMVKIVGFLATIDISFGMKV